MSEGFPLDSSTDSDNLNGGSGGYIAVDVGCTFMFGPTTKISVKGGRGLNSAGYGGSGGRVFINGISND